MKNSRFLLKTVLLMAFILLNVGQTPVYGEPQKKSATANRKNNRGNQNNNTKKNTTQNNTKNNKTAPQETSADVKKQQEATQKEIRQTESELKENEKSVKKGLNELGKLEGDINVSKTKIGDLTTKIKGLSGKISALEGDISKNEAELQKLRDEYLKAVKKMRVSRKTNSTLAFIFSSANFSQALRRMRYMKEFSKWRDKQTAEITHKVDDLKKQRESLALAKKDYDNSLALQKQEQNKLEQQYVRQDAIVIELKKNGDALRSHLSKKQAEANALKNRVSALIAEEQRKAEAERERAEAAKRAEAERKAKAEEEKRAKAEAERKAAEEQRLLAQAEKERKAAEETQKKEVKEQTPKQETKKQQPAKQETKPQQKAEPKKEQKKEQKPKQDNKKETKQSNDNNLTYADARRRKPRGDTQSSSGSSSTTSNAAPSAKTTSTASAGNFADMKGKLPQPVSGSFKVTSRFGPQALPDLPDVVYDNPGIDAEVGRGASALAVFGGNVSGVYMVPGFNTVVIVNHGNYYTVYGNIQSPSVKVGDSVRAGQALGAVAADEDDASHGSLHFEVWRNREKLNPLEWLR